MSSVNPTGRRSLRSRSRSHSRHDSESAPPSFDNLSSRPPSWHAHSDQYNDEPFMPRMRTTTTIMGGAGNRDVELRPPTPPEGVIMVTTEVTIEEVFEELPQAANNCSTNSTDAIFGDSSGHYQANVWSAASQFTRNLFEPDVNNGQSGNVNSINNTNTARTRKWVSIVLLMALVNLITMATESMMPVMIPTLMYDFDVQGFQWLIAGPAIGAAATVLTAGHFYAVFSFKLVYMIFAAILLIATISPGFAPNMAFLFFTRILLGVGLAGQQLGALIYLERDGNNFADKVRRDFFVTVSSALGLIVGPIYGGMFAHRDKKWAWGFYTAFILLALVLLCLLYQLPSNLQTAANSEAWVFGPCLTWSQRLNCMDELGMILSFFGIITLFVAFNFAGTLTSWTNGYVYIPIGIGVVLIVLLALQQVFMILNSPSTRLFPVPYLRHFQTSMLFLMTFLTAAILYIVMPYTAVYQLVTRPEPSAVSTGFYLFFTTTGPYFIFTLMIPIYVGSGLLTQWPIWPSYSIWSLISSVFLLTGSVLLFINTPTLFPSNAGLPTIARELALVCIGFWSAITLSIAHHIMDLLQHPTHHLSNGYPAQRHPNHNRVFILFAMYLGIAVSTTVTGSVFMHLGPATQLNLLAPAHLTAYPATWENAIDLICGYTFVDVNVPEQLFSASVNGLRDTFGWAFVYTLGAATAASVVSGVLCVAKLTRVGLRGVRGRVPLEWRLRMGGPRGQDFELVEGVRATVSGTTL